MMERRRIRGPFGLFWRQESGEPIEPLGTILRRVEYGFAWVCFAPVIMETGVTQARRQLRPPSSWAGCAGDR